MATFAAQVFTVMIGCIVLWALVAWIVLLCQKPEYDPLDEIGRDT